MDLTDVNEKRWRRILKGAVFLPLPRCGGPSRRLLPPIAAVAILVFLALRLFAGPGQAQTNDFWLYDAQGELNFIVTADANGDGLDEFLVVADEQNLALLDSAGVTQWELPPTSEQILAVALATGAPPPEVARVLVGTRNQLLGVTADEGIVVWRTELMSAALEIITSDFNQDGRQEALVATRTGELLLFETETGRQLWSFVGNEEPNARNAEPRIAVADYDQDNVDEIAFAYVAERGFGLLMMINGDGVLSWSHGLPGKITVMSAVDFEEDPRPSLAVGTDQGELHLYDGVDGAKKWLRTPNRGLTAMSAAVLDGKTAVVVGTDVGTVLAFDRQGRRLWDRILGEAAGQPVLDLLVPPRPAARSDLPVHMAAVLPPAGASAAPWQGQIVLLNDDGRPVIQFTANTDRRLNHLLDVNRDGYSELLLASFGTLSLRDMGLGGGSTRTFPSRWTYRLDAEPTASLLLPATADRPAALLVGTEDGRIFFIAGRSGEATLLATYDGRITHLSRLENGDGTSSAVSVVFHQLSIDQNGVEFDQSGLDILTFDNQQRWSEPLRFEGEATLLATLDINENGEEEIILGMRDGMLYSVGLNRRIFWKSNLEGEAKHLVPLREPNDPRLQLVVALQGGRLIVLDNKGQRLGQADLLGEVVGLWARPEPAPLLVVTSVGRVQGLTGRLVEVDDRRLDLAGPVEEALLADQALILRLTNGQIMQLSLLGESLYEEVWRLEQTDPVASFHWDDFNGDARADLALSDLTGNLTLLTTANEPVSRISLASQIVDLYVSSSGESSGLLAVTENGVVHSLSSQPNRPPLLVKPAVEFDGDRLSVSVSVIDIDRDPVNVSLLIYDESLGDWQVIGERRAARGDDLLFWVIPPPDGVDVLRYRFEYDDLTFFGQIEPTPYTIPERLRGINWPAVIIGLVAALVFIAMAVQPAFAPAFWRGWRYYRRLVASSGETLQLMDNIYSQTRGSPDILLALARQARRDGRTALASLVDGLFLLADRTPAGLDVLITALEKAEEDEVAWQHAATWHQLFQTGLALLSAQSVAELGLLRPRLEQLVEECRALSLPIAAFEALLPPLTSFRDCSRVTQVDDRLAYLHEAAVLLRQEQALFGPRPMTVQNTIASAIVNRWHGLSNALIDDLRGRPWIVPTLKTKRLVSGDRTVVVLEIENNGQAAAEEVDIILHESPNYAVVNGSQTIPYLPVRRSRPIHFILAPHDMQDIRLAFTIRYKDANQRQHGFEFADMVRLMSADREFSPIPNPYSPGTPLRRTSPLFFGRQNLLNFIIESAGGANQHNVLILVGQRRTGKTSALLRLEQIAPSQILPVFIDCQSLGVVAGMSAFLNDLAWNIADALDARGIGLAVPPLDTWQKDPAHYFQREFLPLVRSKLPDGTRILLIFDEFEAFENLVNDGILPPTFFPFLRHLMQHGTGLSFIFAGTHRLEEMTSSYWSVLFNIALYRQIGFLDEAAAIELITRPVEPYLIYDDLALDKVWRVTAGHPYFLQLVCYTLVNHANVNWTGYITVSDVNVTLKEMLRLGEVHFAYLWQQSSYAEKALLLAMAHLHEAAGPLHPVNLATSLQAYDIYLEPIEVTAALRSLVIRGIVQEIQEEGMTLYEMRVGLVGMWVAENKSLSELYEATSDLRV